MSNIPPMPYSRYIPWPPSALPCPVCKRRHPQIESGTVDCCIHQYRCPECGFWADGDYVATPADWNSAVRRYLAKHPETTEEAKANDTNPA
jgi:transposase-like protein